MTKYFKYLLFVLILQFTVFVSVNALTESDFVISKTNNRVKVSYNDVFDTITDAKKSVKEFKDYINKNNGKITTSKIDTTIESIDSEILSNSFEVADLNEIDAKVQELQASYDEQATEEKSCTVVLGNVEQIDTPITTYKNESGVIGEYTNAADAYLVSLMVELFENRQDYSIRTSVNRERRVVDTLTHSFNEMYDTHNGAEATKLAYILFGYDVSNVNITERIVTDETSEIQEFESIEAANSYKEQLENQGFRVQDRLIDFGNREEITDQTTVNEDFDSIESLNSYLRNLNNNYNSVDVNITDNSHDEEIRDIVSQDGFETEAKAQEYIDGLRASNDLVYNESITSYEDTVTETHDDVKYFLTQQDANNYLTNLENNLPTNERITSKSTKKLSLSEIDMNDVLTKGNTGLSSSNNSYNYLTINSDNTSLFYYLRVNASGTIRSGRISRINSVSVNGETLRSVGGIGQNTYRLNSGKIPNNSKVVISGVITYVNGLFSRPTVNFTAEGILNSNNDHNQRDNNTFEYNITNVTINGNSATVEDNLVDIYSASSTKEINRTVNRYKAQANIYKKTRINSYNVSGDVANINNIPYIVVKYFKEKDRTVYNLIGDATRDIYRNFYIVNYNAVRTVRSIETTYKQNYTVIETTNIPHYTVTTEGYYDVAQTNKTNDSDTTTVLVPNTGVYDKKTYDYTYILVLIGTVIIGLFTGLRLKNN